MAALLLAGLLALYARGALDAAAAGAPVVRWSTRAVMLAPTLAVLGVAFLAAPSRVLDEMRDDEGNVRFSPFALGYVAVAFVVGLGAGVAGWLWMQEHLASLGYAAP